ncbi:SLBB domain-containing protein [Salinimicrobium sp. TH3]|uniref:SLBB domain-containing protein n=1 Tax=Salinimicrobium sp. TH3 TaxID=2997342 RepID=UPI0022724CD1|nr:SLBB domain-containing protein [Salinimicrobium sp. TH3]MCY2687767.1 SLBB domain-containing protein [Salinimicrobium sp. TH3]
MKKIIVVLLMVVGISATGQSLQDIQNVKVDNLSDAQIEQLIQRAESSGLSEDQLEVMARERGMPAIEVAKLRQRIMKLKSGRKETSIREEIKSGAGRVVVGAEDVQLMFDSIRKSDPYYDLSPIQKKIFGFTLFHNKELDFNPSLNLPTPKSYIIGAGDELLIDIYGASQQNYELKVSPDGSIFIPNIGPVRVGGMSIESASSKLRASLTNIYSGMAGSNPNTFLDIRLGDIRTINVSLVGELRKPGTYTLPSFASVFNAMFAAGGPNENGTFRNIQVYRDNKLLGKVDIYDFLLNGGQDSNLMLRDNDVVIVQPINSRVEITGPVRRPGLFEMENGETIDDLIRFAGGFSDKAYKQRITVRRSTATGMRVDDIGQDFYDTFSPQDGDEFKVGEILERFENRVQISGAVMRPGEFALSDELTVLDLIAKAGGLRGDSFTNRATLHRTGPNLRQEIKTIDLEGIMNNTSPNVVLQREDILNISSIFDLNEEYYIKISGEVNRTGVFPFSEGMTVGDLVVEARGLKNSATNSFIEVARRKKGDNDGEMAEIFMIEIDPELNIRTEDEELILKPFDHVFVRKSPGFLEEKLVQVEGEVLYPGDFVLEKRDERISDLLKRAGGFNQFAYPQGATLVRRTESFKELNEEQKKIKRLQSLLNNMDRGEEVVNSDTEKQFIERIEQRIELLQEEITKKGQRVVRTEDIILERTQNLDSAIAQTPLKETELIGIELKEILAHPGSKYDLILQEGDVLRIPKELQTVRMRGEVLFPTTARFEEGRGFRNYISRAGGFSEDSRKGKSYVIYANGEVKQTQTFLGFKFYPRIAPGAEIVVPKKPEKNGLSPQAWISISSGLATIALLISQIIQ